MSERTATCACTRLRATCRGEPEIAVACHCGQCQLRTGSVLSVHAFFQKSLVTVQGESKSYTRMGDSGRRVTFHFCPECGTSVYWDAEARPALFGVAVGAFNDPQFPAPVRSVWSERKHSWVRLPEGMPDAPRGSQPAKPSQ